MVDLISIVSNKNNCVSLSRGNTGTVADILDKSGMCIPVYKNLWTGSTHSISGTVKLAGSGVVGAKVIILVGDDTSLSNLYLFGTVTTQAGGAWSMSGIPDSKLAFAYAQDYTGGTYYSATGAPFIP